MEQTVKIAALTRNCALEDRIRRGIELWAEERCVQVDLPRREDILSSTGLSAWGASAPRQESCSDVPLSETILTIVDYTGTDEAVEAPGRCAVAVCTGEREAIRAYRSHPAACIPPDFTYPLLCGAMDRCRDLWRSGIRRLSGLPLPMGQIQYAEARGKETVLHTPAGTVTARLLLGRVADLLPCPPFFRCHSGFLVSLPAVSEVGAGEAVMADGERVPVSRRYAGKLRSAWEAWRRDRETL